MWSPSSPQLGLVRRAQVPPPSWSPHPSLPLSRESPWCCDDRLNAPPQRGYPPRSSPERVYHTARRSVTSLPSVVPEGRGRVDATGGLPGRRQERIPPSSDLSSLLVD